MKAVLLVSMKMPCSFLELLENARSSCTGSPCGPPESCLQCSCFKCLRSFSPGSCCLINDDLKISSPGALWAKLNEPNSPAKVQAQLSHREVSYLVDMCSSDLSHYLKNSLQYLLLLWSSLPLL